MPEWGNGRWPAGNDLAGWRALANQAMQEATLAADLAESAAWEATMHELVARCLTYEEFIAARHEALAIRLRRRKLDQSNIRYRFGFRHRARYLVRIAIREHFNQRTNTAPDTAE